MAYTEDQLTKLQDAYAQGILTVRYSDKQITYRSREEMRQIMTEMEISLGKKTRTQRVFTKFSKGLE